MPTRYIVAGCNAASGIKSGQGCSFHSFLKDEGMRRKCTIAVKSQRKDWKGPNCSVAGEEVPTIMPSENTCSRDARNICNTAS